MIENKKQHGGTRQGAGRPKSPGYAENKKCRFLDEHEEILYDQVTPRQRVEIVLERVRERKDEI